MTCSPAFSSPVIAPPQVAKAQRENLKRERESKGADPELGDSTAVVSESDSLLKGPLSTDPVSVVDHPRVDYRSADLARGSIEKIQLAAEEPTMLGELPTFPVRMSNLTVPKGMVLPGRECRLEWTGWFKILEDDFAHYVSDMTCAFALPSAAAGEIELKRQSSTGGHHASTPAVTSAVAPVAAPKVEPPPPPKKKRPDDGLTDEMWQETED